MNKRNLSVLIVDDHPIFRKGLISILTEYNSQITTFEASNAKEMFYILKNNNVDLIILDINLPDLDGVEVLKKIKKLLSKIKVLIITMYTNSLIVEQTINQGAHGFVCKESIYENLILAIEKIFNNEIFIDPDLSINNINSNNKEDLYFLLTETEKKVFKLLAEGKNYKEIALILNKSFKTIDNHRTSIMKKLQINSATDLVKIAMKLNIIKI